MLFIHDYAQLFSASTAARVDRRIAAVRARTGETLVVVTVPRLAGAQEPGIVEAEAERIFDEEGVRGALLYVDRDDRRDALVAQPASWFDARHVASLRRAMETRFAAGSYDAGLREIAGGVLAVYQVHAAAADESVTKAAPRLRVYAWIAAALLAYLVVRASLRSGRRARSRP